MSELRDSQPTTKTPFLPQMGAVIPGRSSNSLVDQAPTLGSVVGPSRVTLSSQVQATTVDPRSDDFVVPENVLELFNAMKTNLEAIVFMTDSDIVRVCDDVEHDSMKNVSLKLNLQMVQRRLSGDQNPKNFAPFRQPLEPLPPILYWNLFLTLFPFEPFFSDTVPRFYQNHFTSTQKIAAVAFYQSRHLPFLW